MDDTDFMAHAGPRPGLHAGTCGGRRRGRRTHRASAGIPRGTGRARLGVTTIDAIHNPDRRRLATTNAGSPERVEASSPGLARATRRCSPRSRTRRSPLFVEGDAGRPRAAAARDRRQPQPDADRTRHGEPVSRSISPLRVLQSRAAWRSASTRPRTAELCWPGPHDCRAGLPGPRSHLSTREHGACATDCGERRTGSRTFRPACPRSSSISRAGTASSAGSRSERSSWKPHCQSGSLITARLAGAQGRECSPFRARSTARSRAAAHRLIRQGADRWSRGVDDIFPELAALLGSLGPAARAEATDAQQDFGPGVGQGLRNPVRCARLRAGRRGHSRRAHGAHGRRGRIDVAHPRARGADPHSSPADRSAGDCRGNKE